MSIAIICNQYPPNTTGGLGIYMQRFLNHYKNYKEDILFYTMNYPHEITDTNFDKSITLKGHKPGKWLRKMIDKHNGRGTLMSQIIIGLHVLSFNCSIFLSLFKARRDISLIVIHDWMNGPVGFLSSILLRKRMIWHIHSNEITIGNYSHKLSLFKMLISISEKLTSIAANKIIVPSSLSKQILVDNKWNSEKIVVIPHGYESDEYYKITNQPLEEKKEVISALKKNHGIGKNDIVLLFVGRLTFHKGIYLLINALKDIVDQHKNVKLVLIGGGNQDEITRIEHMIQKLQLKQYIIKCDKMLAVRDVLWYYHISDICIFPSLYEPFGLVAVEAMSLGKPVILGTGFTQELTQIPFLPNTKVPEGIILKEESRFTVSIETSDHTYLSGIIKKYINDNKLVEYVASASQQYITSQFSWNNTIQKTFDLYKSVACL